MEASPPDADTVRRAVALYRAGESCSLLQSEILAGWQQDWNTMIDQTYRGMEQRAMNWWL